MVVESEKGLDVVAVVYRWRVGDYDYHKITTQVQTDDSPIWIRDVQGDMSVYENQTYIEHELERQLKNGLIEYLGSVHSMQVDTTRPFYYIYDNEGRSLVSDFTPKITHGDTVKFDPAEMLGRINKYLEKIA